MTIKYPAIIQYILRETVCFMLGQGTRIIDTLPGDPECNWVFTTCRNLGHSKPQRVAVNCWCVETAGRTTILRNKVSFFQYFYQTSNNCVCCVREETVGGGNYFTCVVIIVFVYLKWEFFSTC